MLSSDSVRWAWIPTVHLIDVPSLREDHHAAVFSLDSNRRLRDQVCEHLGVAPGCHEERTFEDGEHKIRPLQSVRDQDVYIVESLYSDDALSVNDKLVRTLFFLDTLPPDHLNIDVRERRAEVLACAPLLTSGHSPAAHRRFARRAEPPVAPMPLRVPLQSSDWLRRAPAPFPESVDV